MCLAALGVPVRTPLLGFTLSVVGQTVGWKNGAGIHERGRLQDFHAKSGTSGAVDTLRTNGEAEDGCRS